MKYIFSISLFLVLCSNFVFADGGFFSETDLDLFEPSQKAIIIWRPYTEVLIVSSQVKAARMQDLEKLAWVIPIFSGRKPTVEPSSQEIFQAFKEYFPQVLSHNDDDTFDGDLGSAGGESFQVLEQKKIDVYDVSIIKATDVSVMMTWLKDNGYFIPQVAKKILQTYVDEGAHYFVANKINLVNELGSDIKNAKAFAKAVIADDKREEYLGNNFAAKATLCHLVNKDKEKCFQGFDDDLFMEDVSVNYARLVSFLEYLHALIAIDIVSGMPYEQSIANGAPIKQLSLLNRAKYKELLRKFGSEAKLVKDVMAAFNGKPSILAACKRPMNVNGTPSIYADRKNIERVFGSREAYRRQMKRSFKNVRQFYQSILSSLDLTSSNKLKKVFLKVKDLNDGMCTPLAINFNPSGPTFPLRISSMHKGTTAIELYLCAKQKAIDKNKMLPFDQSKPISKSFREKVAKWIAIPETAVHVSRFRYDGKLSNFTKDAFFGRHPDSFK